MSKTRWLIPLMMLLLVLPERAVFAADLEQYLQNYHYIQTNQAGTKQGLRDKFNQIVIYADSSNYNGQIMNATFNLAKLDPADKLYIEFPDGSKQYVTTSSVTLNKPAAAIEIYVDKVTTTETYVTLERLGVDDPDHQGGLINYHYNQLPPTNPGDLPDGSIGGVDVPHKFFYQDYKDQYRLDFWDAPSSSAKVRLLFTSPSGTPHERNWPYDQVGGTLYLTCQGTYNVVFEDASGRSVGKIENLETTQIQSGLCASYPDPFPKNDLNANVEKSGCTQDPSTGTTKVTWEPHPGAAYYDIYKDGQKVDSTTGTEYDLPSDGSYSVVAKDGSGNLVGESDVNTHFIDPVGNGDADAICQCIRDLAPILEEIRDNTGEIIVKLDETNRQLQQVNDNLQKVLNQITPKKEYPLPAPVKKPELYKPDPVMDQKYNPTGPTFTDQGEAPAPDAMPAAPEPDAWEYNGVKLSPDAEIGKQVEMSKGNEQVKQPDIVQEPVPTQDAPLKQDTPMTQDKTVYPLRWKSSEYNP